MNADSHKKLFHLRVHRPRAAESFSEAQAEREACGSIPRGNKLFLVMLRWLCLVVVYSVLIF